MYNLIIELNACAAFELVKRMSLRSTNFENTFLVIYIHVSLPAQIQSRQYSLFKQCQLNILAG